MERVDHWLAHLTLPPPISPPDPPGTGAPPGCPACRGVGYLRMDAPVGHPDFGRVLPCTCKQTAPARAPVLPGDALPAFAAQTFATFDPAVPGTLAAFQACRSYADNLAGWLVLRGGLGAGKTHLAAAVAHRARERGTAVYFAVAPDLLDHLRATYAPTSAVSYDDRFEAVRTVGLLVVDDLGAEYTTPWVREKLYQLFNHRYVYRLPTAVTTNQDLGSLDGRLASRLNDVALCTQVRVEAGDYRQRVRDR